MGLYVVHDQSTMLVALGKLYDTSSSTHNVPYANDVVRVSVVTVYHGDAQIPFLMSEVRFVSQAVGIFVAWPKHLFKVVSHEVIYFSSESICDFVVMNYMYTNCYYH